MQKASRTEKDQTKRELPHDILPLKQQIQRPEKEY
jgi:hypothetical protein